MGLGRGARRTRTRAGDAVTSEAINRLDWIPISLPATPRTQTHRERKDRVAGLIGSAFIALATVALARNART